MQAKEYFDDIAECWDNEFEFHIVARNTAALVSGAASGAYILDKTTPRLIQFHTLKNAVNPPFLGGFLFSGTVAA